MFHFYLNTTEQLNPGDLVENGRRDYDPELDNLISLFDDACDCLQLSGNVEFRVEGFGQTHWPVDVRTDLSVFAEQLPGLVRWTDTGAPADFELSFYEQGVQRNLTFHEANDCVSVTCVSWGKWVPEYDEERLSLAELVHMVREIVSTFVTQVTIACPNIAVHPWFQEWIASVQISRLP